MQQRAMSAPEAPQKPWTSHEPQPPNGDPHSSMLRLLGDHLQMLGGLIKQYGSAQDSESAHRLQRDIRILATARDSPLGEGYLVPGANVNKIKWKPLVLEYGWDLPPLDGIAFDRLHVAAAAHQQIQLGFAKEPKAKKSNNQPTKSGFSRESTAENKNDYKPAKLGFSRVSHEVSDDYKPLQLGFARSSDVSNGRSSVEGTEAEEQIAAKGSMGARFDFVNSEASDAPIEVKNTGSFKNVSKISSKSGRSGGGGGGGAAKKTILADPNLRCTMAACVAHPLSNARKTQMAAMKLDHETDSEEAEVAWLGIFTSKFGDVMVATAILSNAFILGLQADFDWDGWEIIEVFFTIFFSAEMLLKMRSRGCREYWLGPDWCWNWFDACIVGIAIADFTYSQIIVKLKQSGSDFNIDDLILIKMARLCRLARLARLLRFKIFAQLKMMIHGVVAGLRVLVWAIILLFSFIYVVALVMRKAVRGVDDVRINDPFSRVPWAMFTIFRCFTDGCSAHDGTPLQAHMYLRWGAKFMVPYMLTFLFVTIGLFNLIMAIFVDNVMENTQQRKRHERAAGSADHEKDLRKLLVKLYKQSDYATSESEKAAKMDHVPSFTRSTSIGMHKLGNALGLKMKQSSMGSETSLSSDEILLDRDCFTEIFDNPLMQALMESLEITTCDRAGLFDVLDADLSGELSIDEVVVGLMNLRGPAEKTDMVGTLLCVRVIQEILRGFEEDVSHANDQIFEKIMDMEEKIVEMDSAVNELIP